MSLADRTFAAVIFDNDGTLVDSTGSVERSWVRWAVEHGVDPYALVGHHGMPAAAIIASVAPHVDAAAALRRIEQLEVDDVEGVIALPGVHDALEALAHAPVAVATSATRDRATVRLAAARIAIDEVVTFDDVELTPSRALDIVLQQHREAIHRQLLETQLSESAWNASADLAPVALPKAVGAVLS